MTRLCTVKKGKERKIIARWDKIKYFKKHKKELDSSS